MYLQPMQIFEVSCEEAELRRGQGVQHSFVLLKALH